MRKILLGQPLKIAFDVPKVINLYSGASRKLVPEGTVTDIWNVVVRYAYFAPELEIPFLEFDVWNESRIYPLQLIEFNGRFYSVKTITKGFGFKHIYATELWTDLIGVKIREFDGLPQKGQRLSDWEKVPLHFPFKVKVDPAADRETYTSIDSENELIGHLATEVQGLGIGWDFGNFAYEVSGENLTIVLYIGSQSSSTDYGDLGMTSAFEEKLTVFGDIGNPTWKYDATEYLDVAYVYSWQDDGSLVDGKKIRNYAGSSVIPRMWVQHDSRFRHNSSAQHYVETILYKGGFKNGLTFPVGALTSKELPIPGQVVYLVDVTGKGIGASVVTGVTLNLTNPIQSTISTYTQGMDISRNGLAQMFH